MQRLPRLSSQDARHWRLPLTDAVAGELLQALLIDDVAERSAWLAELMASDPALAIWSLVRSGRWQFQPPASVAEVAEWLSGSALSVLRWSRDELRDLGSLEPADRSRWSGLTARSVGVARGAAAGCRAAADRAYLLGLLSNAVEWLESCGPPVPPGGTLFPPWLIAWPDRLAAGTRLDAAERAVAGARAADASTGDREPWRRDLRARWARHTQLGFDAALPLLVARLNRLDTLEREFDERLETEKLAALRELAYGASHEINNPLANISSRAQTLLRDEPDPERRRKLAAINTQAFRAHEMIADMMLFARPPAPHLVATDIPALLNEVAGEMEAEAAEQGTSIAVRATGEPLELPADPHQLATAVAAVVRNALEALRTGGRVDLSAGWSGPERSRAWIAIEDTGPGIPEPVRRHLFDPFYSGREAGRGLGLGLAKCWTIVAAHGGRIEVESAPDTRTRFILWLPAAVAAGLPLAATG